MHKQGYQIWSSLWRNDTFVTDINRVDFYDFKYQQVTNINLTLYPGDRISHHCVFKQNRDSKTVFGIDSDTEMCLNLIAYYPKIPGNNCAYRYDAQTQKNYTVCGTVELINLPNPSTRDPLGGDFKSFGIPNQQSGACFSNTTNPPIVTTTTPPQPSTSSIPNSSPPEKEKNGSSVLVVSFGLFYFCYLFLI